MAGKRAARTAGAGEEEATGRRDERQTSETRRFDRSEERARDARSIGSARSGVGGAPSRLPSVEQRSPVASHVPPFPAPPTMSWQDYVDRQLMASRCVTKAAIAGHDGNVWAKSDNFDVSKEEIAKLVQGFDKTELLTGGGVTLAGQRYIYLSGTDRVVRAKLGKIGVHCMKTQQAIVVSLYEEPIQPQQAASVVEKLGDYLITCGY